MMYRVEIREVHVSIREVEGQPNDHRDVIIQRALDEDNEVDFEYSHTMDSSHHTVEKFEVEEEINENH